MSKTLQLAALGASPAETAELLAYNENLFDLGALGPETRFPLPDEPFVPFWESVAEEARTRGAFAALAGRLPQLRFPIRAGISETAPYKAATRRGVPADGIPEATGLGIGRPEAIEVVIHPSLAGRIPLLVARGREEFVALLRALTKKNEPEPVPDAQGALMVSGYNNWCRIAGLRSLWEAQAPEEREAATWAEEFQRIQARRELYQDRFILLSDGPYSAVPAASLGLGEAEWREMSLVIRREHECAHYFTRRLFGSMRNNVLDELIADYAGLMAATGRFPAGWFLRFVGLEDFPRYRPGGRLDLYRGKPPLSDGAFRVLQALLKAAAETLERFPPEEMAVMIPALASLRLEDLAREDGEAALSGAVRDLRRRLAGDR